MKTLKYLFFALIAVVSFVSCNQNDFDVPPIEEPQYTGPAANTTIQELKAAYESIINANGAKVIPADNEIIIKAVIVGNDKSGNIYKKLVIEDASGAIDVAINQTSLYNSYPVGQIIYLKCNGLVIGGYGKQAQLGAEYNGGVGQMTLSTFQNHASLQGWPLEENMPVIPVLTYADLSKAGNDALKSMLVRFNDVSFENGGKAVFASGTLNEQMQQNVVFPDGNKIIIRTSSYASFAKDTLPQGKGDMVAILGSFNGAWQLTLRAKADLIDFDGSSSGGGGGSTDKVFIDEPFDVSLGAFKSIQKVGNFPWTINSQYKYAIVTANVKEGTNNIPNAAQTWLVSAPIDLTDQTAVYLTFDHAINYIETGTLKTNHLVRVSDNYTADPATATWTNMDVTYPAGNSFTIINTGKVAIPAAYLGKKSVTIALEYISSATKSSTWEVKNFKVASGEAGSGGGDPEPPTDGGTKEDPYTLAEAVAAQGQTGKWVKAYIVGCVQVKDIKTESVFVAPFENLSNILIAASATETDYKKCIPVQLPAGDIRTTLNLNQNSDNLGKVVNLKGDLATYFGVPGLKAVSEFAW